MSDVKTNAELAHNTLDEQLACSATFLAQRFEGYQPTVGLILGSGLNSFATGIEEAVCIPFADVPFMKTSTATGHVGQFVCGMLKDVCVLAMQGRLHGYEGYSAQEVAYPVWLMNRLGVRTLITTNAVGALNPDYRVGDFCIMSDQINFTGRNPLASADPAELSDRFVSMKDAFDPDLRTLAHEVADAQGIGVCEGVYLGVLGPSFETPAEIRMFRSWGADTVAMSVIEEVIAARHSGMHVLGISLISNMGCGIEGACPTDAEVHEVAKGCEANFECLMTGILERLHERS